MVSLPAPSRKENMMLQIVIANILQESVCTAPDERVAQIELTYNWLAVS